MSSLQAPEARLSAPAPRERSDGDGLAPRIRRVVAGVVPLAGLDDDDDLFEAGYVNSLVLARLLAFLETDCGVEVEDSELVADNFRSVSAIVAFVERKRETPPVATAPAAGVGAPAWDGDAQRSIGRRFLAVAAAHPGAAAIETPVRTISYADLALRARRIAGGIAARTGRGARVAIALTEPEDNVAVILATLLSGRVYAPIDPGFPRERIDATLEDAAPELLVTEGPHGDRRFPAVAPAALEQESPLPLDDVASEPDAVASLLYTSGSSGRPKGVLQSHRNVLFHIRTLTERFAIGPHDKHSLLASFSFDASTTDLYCTVLNGATLVPLDLRRSGFAAVARRLADRGVTLYHSTPTVFRQLVGALPAGIDLSRLRLVILGGEPVTRNDFDAFRRHFSDGCRFVNGFGATETSGFAALYELTGGSEAPPGVLPVGRPPDGMELWLRERDRPDEELPEGEIAITSRHVALGYLHDRRDGAGTFQETPQRPGFRTYWTGDVGRRLPDGAVALLGRRDRQVKVRGFRVELPEVEAALVAHDGVRLAAAVVRRERGGAPEDLVAVVEAAPGRHVDAAEIRRGLAGSLPDYMLPGRIDVVDALPLTPTGKVDVAAVERSVAGRRVPRVPGGVDGTGAVVASIWADLLDAEAIGPDDAFYDLGGNSMLLARVHERLERELGREIPAYRLFENPTVRSLAAYLDGTSAGSAPALRDARRRMEQRRAARARRRTGGPAR